MIKKLCLFLVLSVSIVQIAVSQRFAVLNDIHVTPGNPADSALRVAIGQINDDAFDAVIINGDLTNEGSDEQLENVYSILSNITHPLFVLPGNHENNWSQSATRTFPRLWGDDRFVATIDSTIIIGVNCGPFMKMGDGHVKQEDLIWLNDTLSHLCTDGKRVISFNHYPIRKDDLDNYRDYATVLSRFPVVAHINGHYHRTDTYEIGELPGIMLRSFIPAKTPGYQYSIVELKGDTLNISEKFLDKDSASPIFNIPVRNRLVSDTCTFAEHQNTVAAPDGFNITEVFVDKASIFTRIGFDNDNAYVANSLGQLIKLDKTSGEPVWTIDTDATIFSRPVVLKSGRVAFPHHQGIFIVDSNVGAIVDTLALDFATPYVADGIIYGDKYLQGGYKRFEARDGFDGSNIWRYDSINNYCQAAPAVEGDNIVFGAWDTYLRCLDLSTGKERWKWSNGKSANMLGPGNVVPVITHGRVYIVAPDRYMTAISLNDGSTLWRNNDLRYRESLGVSDDGNRVFAKTMDGELAVIDASVPEFKSISTVDMGLGYDHAPCIVAERDGVIYAGSRRGIITAIDGETLTPIWQREIGVSEINGIDLDPYSKSVWVSLIEGKVVKIDKE